MPLQGIFLTFGIPRRKGRVAERLGRGLQNLVQRFESARDLQITPVCIDTNWGSFLDLSSVPES